MTISELIQSFLQEARQTKTQREIAKRLAISPGYLNHLMSGKQDISQITLGTFSRMFPRAEVFLDGAPGRAVADHGAAAAVNGNATVNAAPTTAPAPDAEALRARIIGALIRADLPADALKTALTVVQDTR